MSHGLIAASPGLCPCSAFGVQFCRCVLTLVSGASISGSELFCRSGNYCIEPEAYSFKNVGKMALRSKFLKDRLEGAVRVQNTVAVPFGAINQIMSSHHENGRPFGIIQRALSKIGKARENGTATVDQEKNILRVCRCTVLSELNCLYCILHQRCLCTLLYCCPSGPAMESMTVSFGMQPSFPRSRDPFCHAG